jgi:hypothetical protein
MKRHRGAKSKLLGQMGTDIGSIGKEQADAQLAGALTGYSRKGDLYTNLTELELHLKKLLKLLIFTIVVKGSTLLKKGDKYIDENGKTQQLKMGGYLTTKKYKNNMNRYDTISTSAYLVVYKNIIGSNYEAAWTA